MRVAEFLVFLLVALSGFGGVPGILVVPVGLAGLLASTWPKYFALRARAVEMGKLGVFGLTLAASAAQTAAFVFAAFGLGVVARHLMGVAL